MGRVASRNRDTDIEYNGWIEAFCSVGLPRNFHVIQNGLVFR